MLPARLCTATTPEPHSAGWVALGCAVCCVALGWGVGGWGGVARLVVVVSWCVGLAWWHGVCCAVLGWGGVCWRGGSTDGGVQQAVACLVLGRRGTGAAAPLTVTMRCVCVWGGVVQLSFSMPATPQLSCLTPQLSCLSNSGGSSQRDEVPAMLDQSGDSVRPSPTPPTPLPYPPDSVFVRGVGRGVGRNSGLRGLV